LRGFVCIAIGLIVGCGGEEMATAPPTAPEPPLVPEAQLTGGCFDWPQVEFSPDHHPAVGVYLTAGERAIEFTLEDVSGVTRTLSSLLESRPVFLIFGSFT
jgi:hypothetical protein